VRVDVTLGVSAAVDVGSLPAPSAGLGAVFGVHRAPFGVDLRGAAWSPQVATSRVAPGEGGQIGLYAGSLVGCLDVLPLFGGRYALSMCAGPEVGVTTGEGLGIRRPSHPSGLWTAALAGLALQSAAPSAAPLAVSLSLDLGVPFRAPAFALDGADTVFEAAPVVGRATLDVAWRAP
jgi:hypothetical protein